MTRKALISILRGEGITAAGKRWRALTDTQRAFLERVVAEGEVATNGRHEKTIYTLFARGLVTYEWKAASPTTSSFTVLPTETGRRYLEEIIG